MQGMRKATREDLVGIAELLAPLEQRGILKPRSREQLKAELPHYIVIDLEVLPLPRPTQNHLLPRELISGCRQACVTVTPASVSECLCTMVWVGNEAHIFMSCVDMVVTICTRVFWNGTGVRLRTYDVCVEVVVTTCTCAQGQLLGCALLAPLDAAPDGARCAEVAAFCVAPEFRGTGRGDTLLEYLGDSPFPRSLTLWQPTSSAVITMQSCVRLSQSLQDAAGAWERVA